MAGDSKTKWHAQANRCPLDTYEALISPVVEQGLIVRISNGDQLGGLARVRLDFYRGYASPIPSGHYCRGYFCGTYSLSLQLRKTSSLSIGCLRRDLAE